MKRIIYFLLCTATALVLLFGYRTSLSSRAVADSSAVAPVIAVAPATSTGDASAAATSTSTESTSDPATAAITVPTTTSAKSSTSTGKTAGKAASTATSDPAATTSAATKATTSSAVATTTAAAAATTVTGQSVDTRWGPVQVQLTVQGGKVTAVDVLVYPNGNGRDQEINAQALPILVQETLSAQSAKIDAVSGATVTSDGYIGSLQSALDQAGL